MKEYKCRSKFRSSCDGILTISRYAIGQGGNDMSDLKKPGFMTRIRNKVREKKGQSTVEYVLILAIVLMLASNVKSKLTGVLDNKIGKIEQEIDQFQ